MGPASNGVIDEERFRTENLRGHISPTDRPAPRGIRSYPRPFPAPPSLRPVAVVRHVATQSISPTDRPAPRGIRSDPRPPPLPAAVAPSRRRRRARGHAVAIGADFGPSPHRHDHGAHDPHPGAGHDTAWSSRQSWSCHDHQHGDRHRDPGHRHSSRRTKGAWVLLRCQACGADPGCIHRSLWLVADIELQTGLVPGQDCWASGCRADHSIKPVTKDLLCDTIQAMRGDGIWRGLWTG